MEGCEGGWGCDDRPGRKIARLHTYPPGHGLMPAAAPGSLQGLAGGDTEEMSSAPVKMAGIDCVAESTAHSFPFLQSFLFLSKVFANSMA